MAAPGSRVTKHWRVGRVHDVLDAGAPRSGVCVSVTYWGSNQVRWVRLQFPGGKRKSYAPSHLRVRPPNERK